MKHLHQLFLLTLRLIGDCMYRDCHSLCMMDYWLLIDHHAFYLMRSRRIRAMVNAGKMLVHWHLGIKRGRFVWKDIHPCSFFSCTESSQFPKLIFSPSVLLHFFVHLVVHPTQRYQFSSTSNLRQLHNTLLSSRYLAANSEALQT